jgi:hypothetical protein
MNPADDRIAVLEARVRELEDVRAIEALAATYHRLCDGGWSVGSHADLDGLVALWTSDGIYSINPQREPCRGHEAIREQFLRLRTSMPWIFHTFANTTVTVDGDSARGEFKGVAYYRRSGGSHIVVGTYTGEFVRTDDGWRFSSWVADLAHGSVLSTDEDPIR